MLRSGAINKKNVLVAVFLCATIFLTCTDTDVVIDERREVAETYCSKCHLLPEPDELEGKTWLTGVLPKMGAYYGIYDGIRRGSLIPDSIVNLRIGHWYPLESTLDAATWQQIKNYYIDNAPDKLASSDADLQLKTQNRFKKINVSDNSDHTKNDITTLITFDTINSNIIIGGKRGGQGILNYYDTNHHFQFSHMTSSAPVKIMGEDVLSIGSLSPSDVPQGILSSREDSMLLKHLARPVDMLQLDLDQDGQLELIVAEYGHTIGELNSYKQNTTGQWIKDKTLINQAGAIMLRSEDLDKDGYKDLFVLFGQGDEGVIVIYSRPNDVEISRLLRFPPTYGSSSMRVVDFNKDGHLDIFTTNGDNLDYEPLPKPYHGIRYFQNNGDNSFEEKWFYPFDGAYSLEVADFDLDGDYDIAAIAYFTNPLERSTQSFVYLEQTRPGFGKSPSFVPSSFMKPVDEHYLCMTSGDIDADGDIDLLIGNTSVYLPDGLSNVPDKRESPYIVLENVTR